MNELKDDVLEYYRWAERQEKPTIAYGVTYHLFELECALNNLNQYINQNIKIKS
jgi:hypothetical protein